MRFSTQILALVLSLSATTLGAPVSKRALTEQSFNEFTVSGGTAGKALEEVNANFPVRTTTNALSPIQINQPNTLSRLTPPTSPLSPPLT